MIIIESEGNEPLEFIFDGSDGGILLDGKLLGDGETIILDDFHPNVSLYLPEALHLMEEANGLFGLADSNRFFISGFAPTITVFGSKLCFNHFT